MKNINLVIREYESGPDILKQESNKPDDENDIYNKKT